ncbi:hypothetical protein QQF64_014617 [Cirrhinus molitorella]|uniref:Uncharacterized protein n=1 Tax=Cirrhinus molitorella TaxID=172907 RepID=A0ABR3NTC9_9TELE
MERVRERVRRRGRRRGGQRGGGQEGGGGGRGINRGRGRDGGHAGGRRRGRGRGRRRQEGAQRGQNLTNEIRATLVDHIVNHGLTLREAGLRVQPNLSRYTVARLRVRNDKGEGLLCSQNSKRGRW